MSARLDKLSYQQLHQIFKTVIEEPELKMSTCPFKIPAHSMLIISYYLQVVTEERKKVNQEGNGECTSGKGRGQWEASPPNFPASPPPPPLMLRVVVIKNKTKTFKFKICVPRNLRLNCCYSRTSELLTT